VLDRLFTYARGELLTREQSAALSAEGKYDAAITAASLLAIFHKQIDLSLEALKNTDESILTSFRGVGRAQLPSTVLGLMVHAAEHTQRHVGQLLVTAKVIVNNGVPG